MHEMGNRTEITTLVSIFFSNNETFNEIKKKTIFVPLPVEKHIL